jgi:His/Glu/Gln/Arg/opine family amino acid ABC transporter permease subunit
MDLNALVFSFFNLEIAWEYLPDILKGMMVTIELGLVVAITGLVFGMALAVLRALQVRPLNFFIICFADIMRALPPLVVIMMLFFAFPYIQISMSGAFTRAGGLRRGNMLGGYCFRSERSIRSRALNGPKLATKHVVCRIASGCSFNSCTLNQSRDRHYKKYSVGFSRWVERSIE